MNNILYFTIDIMLAACKYFYMEWLNLFLLSFLGDLGTQQF